MAKVVEVNASAHFFTTSNVFKKMIARNSGHIVTVASVAGYLPSAFLLDYCTSKSGAVA